MPRDMTDQALKTFDWFEKRLDEYEKVFLRNPILEQRTRGVGVLSKEDAVRYGSTGTVLRASGIKHDIRRSEPYSAYPAFDFEALLIGMVPVKTLIDSPEGRELARQYEIRTTPAVLITTPEGRLVFLMQGFTSSPEFYQKARADLDTYRQFARRIDSQDIPNLPAGEALATGVELYQRSDPAAALPRLVRAVSAPDATATQRDEAREQLAAVQLELKQVGEARRTTQALLKSTRDSKRRERAEIFQAQLPLYEGKPEEAIRQLQKFVADHPKSEYAAGVKSLLQRLGSAPASS